MTRADARNAEGAARGDRVRVVALTGRAEDHLVLHTAERAPRVGDVGTVVDVSQRLGGVGRHFTVAHTDPDGRQRWLAVFAAHELAREQEGGTESGRTPGDRSPGHDESPPRPGTSGER